VVELLQPISHFSSGKEVINYKTYPAGQQQNNDSQQFLGSVNGQVPNLQSGFDTQNQTDNPNNSSNHNCNILKVCLSSFSKQKKGNMLCV